MDFQTFCMLSDTVKRRRSIHRYRAAAKFWKAHVCIMSTEVILHSVWQHTKCLKIHNLLFTHTYTHHTHTHTHTHTHLLYVSMYLCMYVYVCVYVCTSLMHGNLAEFSCLGSKIAMILNLAWKLWYHVKFNCAQSVALNALHAPGTPRDHGSLSRRLK